MNAAHRRPLLLAACGPSAPLSLLQRCRRSSAAELPSDYRKRRRRVESTCPAHYSHAINYVERADRSRLTQAFPPHFGQAGRSLPVAAFPSQPASHSQQSPTTRRHVWHVSGGIALFVRNRASEARPIRRGLQVSRNTTSGSKDVERGPRRRPPAPGGCCHAQQLQH